MYADDLDLFGAGSLFELISVARTLPGEAMLADWLKSPAELDVALARQAAVEDLRVRVELRQDLAMAGADARAELHAGTLRQWGAAPPVRFFAGAAWVLFGKPRSDVEVADRRRAELVGADRLGARLVDDPLAAGRRLRGGVADLVVP